MRQRSKHVSDSEPEVFRHSGVRRSISTTLVKTMRLFKHALITVNVCTRMLDLNLPEYLDFANDETEFLHFKLETDKPKRMHQMYILRYTL